MLVRSFLGGATEDFQRVSAGSLNRIAEALEVNRVGEAHQAGSDSLVAESGRRPSGAAS